MLDQPRELSFAHPETEFYLPSFHKRVGNHWPGEPTGEVVCITCWESHVNVDEIPHERTCPQRHVHSRYWRETHAEAGESDGAAEAGAD